ncbi:Retrovirus-related Pol polyprotein like [Argiope bruennichi]|uniref:Retrovirus-related Pol polyprotein like n=1 Tax=Argiope bruennichi TaxID=94029 RepID=A0A8T0FRN1_ARGBR|nr:Retrovirus-related Pol polyprotein like [Argiope bruennichi]
MMNEVPTGQRDRSVGGRERKEQPSGVLKGAFWVESVDNYSLIMKGTVNRNKKKMSTKDDIIFNSLDSQPLQTLTIVQLKKELRFRNLSLTGNKNELILRIVEDNTKRNSEGNLEELNVLRAQNLNNVEVAISDNAHLLTEIESLRKQVELLSILLQQSPLPMPPPSQIDPNIADILSTLMETQKQFLERQVNPNVIQITSTNDTANSIQIFKGDIIENALEWLKEVERISTLANWSDELKLTNAISRLSGSAKNWQLTTGKNFNDWITWKNALASRFKRRITMQEFLAHQSERKLRHNESLVDYIYSKDALLEKAPFTIPQPDRISMIIGDITEEKWQIALATQNTNTVEELIDRATALDAIRSAKQEHKKHSPKSQIRSSYTHDEQRRKYNPVTDDVRDITCWRCGNKGHASFMCSLPPPPRGSTIAQPRNTSQQNQYTNSQTNAQIPSSSSSTSSDNNTAVKTISLNSSNSRRNNNNRNSTSGRSTTANSANNNSINCIRTETNRRALIPVIINNDTEIQALCDPCADITIIQQSCVPNDIVINPWTDGQFQVVDHEIKPIGWISLNIIVGNLEHMMPKIGVCTQLPFKLILGFDWQQQVQARCTYDPNGSLCISTPTSFHLYECIHASKPSINCVSLHPPSLPSLDDVLLCQKQHPYNFNPKQTLSLNSQDSLQLNKLNLMQCRPYRLSEPDRQFLKTQIEKWLKQGICRHSNSPYAAPAFIVEQPFHESTSRRIVVDFSRTINPITNIDPHPIDQMEDVIQRMAGKSYSSKMDVKSAFHCIPIRDIDTYKTGFVTPDGHYEFLRMPFGVTNGPSTMTRAIKLAYNHLAHHNVNTYIDDISTSHDDFNYHLKVIYKIFEATQKAGFKLTREKTQFAVSEITLFGRIISQDGVRPDPERIAAIERYLTLKSIHEVRSFLGFANQFRKYIRNYAVIAKPLTSVLKGLEKKTNNAPIVLTEDQQRTFESLKTAISTDYCSNSFVFQTRITNLCRN